MEEIRIGIVVNNLFQKHVQALHNVFRMLKIGSLLNELFGSPWNTHENFDLIGNTMVITVFLKWDVILHVIANIGSTRLFHPQDLCANNAAASRDERLRKIVVTFCINRCLNGHLIWWHLLRVAYHIEDIFEFFHQRRQSFAFCLMT